LRSHFISAWPSDSGNSATHVGKRCKVFPREEHGIVFFHIFAPDKNPNPMPRGILTILLLVCSNAFMTLAWYGHIVFKSKLERVSLAAIVLLSWGVALFEYCFQVPANRIGSVEYGGPFTLWQLKVIQEVITLIVFSSFVLFFSKNESLQWNHIAGFCCLVLAVYFIFRP
jgi:uncharacterized protein (DUF486 family)